MTPRARLAGPRCRNLGRARARPRPFWAEGVTWLWREPSTPRVQTFGPAGPTLGMRRAGTVTLTVEELKG